MNDSGPADEPLAFDGLCTVTMQGGGVYGISLLGQLQAVEELDGLRPIAYAGASAGGLMAALRWAGFKPEEIREELKVVVANREQLATLLSSRPGVRNRWSADPRVVVKVRDRLLRLLGINKRPGNRLLKPFSFAGDLAYVIAKASIGLKAWKAGGLFAADGFADWLDQLLRKRLRDEIETARKTLRSRKVLTRLRSLRVGLRK